MAIASDGAYTTDGNWRRWRQRRARCLCRSLSRARGFFGSTQFTSLAARPGSRFRVFFFLPSFHAAVLLLFSNRPGEPSPLPSRPRAMSAVHDVPPSTVTLFTLILNTHALHPRRRPAGHRLLLLLLLSICGVGLCSSWLEGRGGVKQKFVSAFSRLCFFLYHVT